MPTSDIKKGPLYVDSTNNRVGIKTVAPDLALHVEGTNAAPASSGSTSTGFVSLRQKDGGSSHGANIGVLGVPPWGTWIQGQDANNLATSYPLLLNPNGGSVGIGTSSPSTSHKLTLEHTSNYGGISLKQSGTQVGQIIQEGGTGSIYIDAGSTDANGSLVLRTNFGSERMRIDSSGRVTMPAQPSFRAEAGPLGYITTSPIPFSSVQHNVGSHYSTSTNRFTAPISGVYSFHLHVGFVRINGGSGWAQTELRRNGAQLAYSYFQAPTATAYAPASVSVLISLSANDYIEAIFQQSNANYYANARELQFSGYLVG